VQPQAKSASALDFQLSKAPFWEFPEYRLRGGPPPSSGKGYLNFYFLYPTHGGYLPLTGIPEMLGDIQLSIPKRRGRPRFANEPTITTTIRVTLKDWEWVKKHPGLQFSALLRSKIHQLENDEENPPNPKSTFVIAARRAGLEDSRVAEILKELPQ